MNLLLYFNFLISLTLVMNENNVNLSTQKKQNIIYNHGTLSLIGFNGSGKIEIYTIIGNQLVKLKVKELNFFKLPIKLNSKNIYILRVFNNGRYRSFKFTVP